MPSAASLPLSIPELELRLRQQELVADFGRFALASDDLQFILDRASTVAAEGLQAGFAKVLEFLPGEMAFVVRAGVGWKEGVVGNARLNGDLQSPAGYAFRTGQPVISNHLSSEQRFRTPAILQDHGIRSAVNVLIATRDAEPFGVLEGDSTHRGDFTEHDIAFLQSLSNTLAVAVEAQKRQDLRERLLQENAELLKEKDLLMQEVHHRVTNSLQLVRTILGMQARTLPSPEARAQVEEAAARIMTIGAVHKRLYAGGSVISADVAQYLRGMLADMRGMLPEEADARPLELDTESFQLHADDLTPLGLITGELVTNAIKYGRGPVKVILRRLADGLQISVSDHGSGFPADFDRNGGRGLGMRLVSGLCKRTGPDTVTIDRTVPHGRIVVRTGFGGTG